METPATSSCAFRHRSLPSSQPPQRSSSVLPLSDGYPQAILGNGSKRARSSHRQHTRTSTVTIVMAFVAMSVLFVGIFCTRKPGSQLKPSFLSIDLGGSGLKIMCLHVKRDGSAERRGKRTGRRLAIPTGQEIRLGYIPPHESDPRAWIERKVEESFPALGFRTMQDWPDFASTKNDAFKLWSPEEHVTVQLLEETGRLHIGCEEETHKKDEVPDWAATYFGLSVWCKRWRPTQDVLGFTSLSESLVNFRGAFTDGRSHFEGSRAILEQLADIDSDRIDNDADMGYNLPSLRKDDPKPIRIVSWGLGTGQTILWMQEKDKYQHLSPLYNPHWNRTSDPSESICQLVGGTRISQGLSNDPFITDISQILVDIPADIVEKLKELNFKPSDMIMQERMPFFAIMKGDNWISPFARDALRKIYRTFFRDQVMRSIISGALPKPDAMVFSGGLSNHADMAHLLRDILNENGIESITGYEDAVHCGIVRLAYVTDEVSCEHFDIPSATLPKPEHKHNLGPLKMKAVHSLPSQNLLQHHSDSPDISCLGRDKAQERLTLPNVLLVGAQKSATSAVAEWLFNTVCQARFLSSSGREIFEKEVHYFDKTGMSSSRFDNVTAYGQIYAHCCPGTGHSTKSSVLAMDATPNYMPHAKRIRFTYDNIDPTGSLANNLKIIAILREPSSRELSMYNHMTYNCQQILSGKKTASIDWVLDNCFGHSVFGKGDSVSIIQNFSDFIGNITVPGTTFKPEQRSGYRPMNQGMYARYLREWMSIFEPNQILVLSHDELVKDQPSFLRRIQSFLDLDESILDLSVPEDKIAKNDKKKVKQMTCYDRDRLLELYKPMNDDLYALLKKSPRPKEEQSPFPTFVPPACTGSNDS